MSLKYYRFHQNNSGGAFSAPAINVFIQAESPSQANEIAEKHGVYFDSSNDCECCGPRWEEATEYDVCHDVEGFDAYADWYAMMNNSVPFKLVIDLES